VKDLLLSFKRELENLNFSFGNNIESVALFPLLKDDFPFGKEKFPD